MKNTRKLLSIILAILMIATTVPFAFAADEIPTTREIDGKTFYELDSADDLYWFAEQVNGGNVDINAILTDDIVVNENLLSEKLILTEKIELKTSPTSRETVKVCVAEVKNGESVREWIPMGTELWENMYSGHFNGNGKTISGLYVNDKYEYAGLVGSAYGCTIENLTLEDSYFNCEYNFAGAFVAFAGAPNEHPVYLKNLVNKSVVCGRNAGGILGCAQGTTHISGCINLETVYPFSINYHVYKGGGIAGTILDKFSATDCVNLGNAEYAFGSENDSFTNCYYLDTASKGVPFDTNNVLAVTAEEVASGFVCEKIGGHKTEIITAEPTCTENGFEKIECLICEYSAIQKEIPATNHKDTLVEVEAKAPTCTEIGWDAYEYCTVCDYTTYNEIPATNHKDTLVEVEAKAPTCTEIGWDAYEYCTACDYTTYNEIPASHEIVNVEAKAPTCTEIGWNAYEYCTVCDYTTYVEKAALDHDIVIDAYVAPKCTETGLTAGQHCSRCDDMTIAQEVIPDLGGHINEDGNTTCDRCDEILLCEDCGRPVHNNTFVQKLICLIVMFFNLIKSAF